MKKVKKMFVVVRGRMLLKNLDYRLNFGEPLDGVEVNFVGRRRSSTVRCRFSVRVVAIICLSVKIFVYARSIR